MLRRNGDARWRAIKIRNEDIINSWFVIAVDMRLHLPPITPHHLRLTAIMAIFPLSSLIWWSLLTAGLSRVQLALTLLFLCQALMLAMPRMRSSELLGILAIGITVAEYAAGQLHDGIEILRWADFMGALGAIMLILKVQRWRSLARTDPHVPIRQLERRTFLSMSWPVTAAANRDNVVSETNSSIALARPRTQTPTGFTAGERK